MHSNPPEIQSTSSNTEFIDLLSNDEQNKLRFDAEADCKHTSHIEFHVKRYLLATIA